MTKKINYNEINTFKKSLKKLIKSLLLWQQVRAVRVDQEVELFHNPDNDIDNKSVFLIPGFYDETNKIYKLRKFACRALKGKGARSGIRIIYAYNTQTDDVTFIDIYYKADQENADKQKIEEFLNQHNIIGENDEI